MVFDHGRDTRYPLAGKHRGVKCDSCHRGDLYRDKTDTSCVSCHKGDDKHKGQLGASCDTCHSVRGWRETSFDHQRSGFPLLGKHTRVECRQCHASQEFKDAKPDCLSCHAKEDRHKERLGPRCGQCHNENGWKDWDFEHGKRTRFPLEDSHEKVACTGCHTTPVKDKFALTSDCVSCHRRDDVHFGTYGERCDECHRPDNWRRIIKREGNRTPATAVPDTRRRLQ
jgi:hypothetical protein